MYEENLILYEQIEQYKLVINKAKMVESKQDSTILLLNTNLQYEKNNTETLTNTLDITRKELKRQKRKSTILFGTTVTIGLLALIIAAK